MIGRAPGGGILWATRMPSDDFEHDIHLDSAGHRFGAMARGGSRQRIFGAGFFAKLLHGLRNKTIKSTVRYDFANGLISSRRRSIISTE